MFDSMGEEYVLFDDIERTSLLCLRISSAPCLNDIPEVTTAVFQLPEITHIELHAISFLVGVWMKFTHLYDI